ncbi:hypothetical protein KP509_34G015500 [Ceratopteris richardii]|nr:hypothetical protein KP509_34G015500 [Ceratopteris richardii]
MGAGRGNSLVCSHQAITIYSDNNFVQLQDTEKFNQNFDSCLCGRKKRFNIDDDNDPLLQVNKKDQRGALGPVKSCFYLYNQNGGQKYYTLQSLCNGRHLQEAVDVLLDMEESTTTEIYVCLLRLCIKAKCLINVKNVRDHIVQFCTPITGILGDYLVAALAKCGAVDDAQKIAKGLQHRTVFSYTAIISAFVDLGSESEALEMYECMRKENISANPFTYVSLLKACSNLRDLPLGSMIHVDIREQGLAADNLVGNCLVSMYGKCGDILAAENAFLELSYRDIVSWTAMLSAYLEQKQINKAIQLFRQMHEEGMLPNHLTCIVALKICISLGEKEVNDELAKSFSLELGQSIHAYARKNDLLSDPLIGTTLISMYGKCGSIKMAEHVFNILHEKSIISCNAMLAAYVGQNQGTQALHLFKTILTMGMPPNNLTYVSAIQSCSVIAEGNCSMVSGECSNKALALRIGQALHLDVYMKEFDSNVLIGTALLTMYGKCGCIKEFETIFNDMPSHDDVSWNALFSAYLDLGQGAKALKLHRKMRNHQIILDDVSLMLSWTAMLSGLVEKGKGTEALELFDMMEKEGTMLDDVALKCVLQACCLTGSVNVCMKVHSMIVCLGYDVLESLAPTLIHAYGNCGSMVDAQAIFDDLSAPDIVSWSACIAGHASEGDVSACFKMFERLILADVMPDELTFTSILLVCCHAGCIVRGVQFFQSMVTDYGIIPGLNHYGIVLDLLSRAGDFQSVVEMLGLMHLQVDLTMWMCLLGACQAHENVELARIAFNHAIQLQPTNLITYVMMSDIYATAGLPEHAIEIEAIRQKAAANGCYTI